MKYFAKHGVKSPIPGQGILTICFPLFRLKSTHLKRLSQNSLNKAREGSCTSRTATKKQRRYVNFGIGSKLMFVVLLYTTSAYAGKFDLLTGPFSLAAKVDDREGSVSTVGAYNITYLMDLTSYIQMGVGYTVLMSNSLGGDLAYGIDAGLNYFPFTPAGPISSKTANSLVKIKPLWRPFIGGSFHQRQAQSTESSYAGFGFSGGVERSLDYFFDLKMSLRYILLTGPGSSSATETTFFIGASMPFDIGGK